MKRTTLRATKLWTFLILSMAALISLGCSDSNPTTGGNVNPLGAYTQAVPGVTAITDGTTQGVGQIDKPIVSIPQTTDGRRDHTNAPLLDNWHPGWQQASCFSCHTDQSRIPDHSYTTSDLCYLCHGTNGLPGFGDDIPPIIKGVVVNTANDQVTITWKTDEPCICRLVIRTGDGDRLEFPVGSDYKESHKYVLAGLLPETMYSYEIRATDRNGNLTTTATLGNLCFVTPAKTVTTPGDADMPDTAFFLTWDADLGDDDLSIDVEWSTRVPSTGRIYVYREADGATTVVGPFGPDTSFKRNIASLNAGQSYRVWVVALDADETKFETLKKVVSIPSL